MSFFVKKKAKVVRWELYWGDTEYNSDLSYRTKWRDFRI
jgi:hypothetical protein